MLFNSNILKVIIGKKRLAGLDRLQQTSVSLGGTEPPLISASATRGAVSEVWREDVGWLLRRWRRDARSWVMGDGCHDGEV